MSIIRQIQEAAQAAVSAVRDAYLKERPERYSGETAISPEELLAGEEDARARISFHMQRMTRDAVFTMLNERWARPGAPLFSFEIDTENSMTSRRPGYGPGTLRLRLDMATHAADLKLPEANAELTKAVIGALAVANVNIRQDDLAGGRLLDECRLLLHQHGSPEVITLLSSMVQAAGAQRQ